MRKKLDYSKITRRADSFLARYMTHFANVETAEAYDFWCGVWLLSNVIGRRLRVDRPMAPVYLNVYAVLCAEAGITRKSSAVRHATNTLRAYADRYDASITINSGGLTGESLEETMARLTELWQHAHVVLSSSELVTLLGRERSAMTLPGKLTDLYDCPDIYTRSTRTYGELNSRNVYVTLLGASTPSWLVRAINPDVVEGGFTSRCLFIIEDKPKRLIAWPEVGSDTGSSDYLVEHLHNVRRGADICIQRTGGIRLTRVARDRFGEWYEERRLVSDPYGASFQAREDHHILRLSGILAASDGSWEVDEHHIAHATSVIQHVRSTGSILFGTGVAASRTYTLVDRIRGALVQAGRSGISQSTLSAICRKVGTAQELSDILTIMHEMNLVQKFLVESGERGRPVTMYRATKSMAHARVLDDVVEQVIPTVEA